MTELRRAPGIETLLVHEGLVRGLARALLHGDDRVDDVVQDTWTTALETGPRDPGRLRGWLAQVSRRFALGTLRRDASRRRIEAQAVRPAAAPSAEEILAREATRRSVLEALLALEPEARDALLLRYYEGLPPRDVARRLGVPVETARTRVKRGLERLRERLVRGRGREERTRALLLAQLAAGIHGAGPSAAIGGALVAKKLTVAAVALLAFGAATGWVLDRERTPEAVRSSEGVASSSAAKDAAAVSLVGRGREPVAHPLSPSPSAAVCTLRILRALDGRPVLGAHVRAADRMAPAFVTDEGGRVAIPRDSDADFDVVVVAEGLLGGRRRVSGWRAGAAFEVALPSPGGFPGQSVYVAGRVVGADGRPVAEADVMGYAGEAPVATARTDADGRFAFQATGMVPRLVAHHPSHGRGSLEPKPRHGGSNQWVGAWDLGEIVLRLEPMFSIPVAVDGNLPAGEASLALRLDPLDPDPGGLTARTLAHRSGDTVEFPVGTWDVTALEQVGGVPLAPPVRVVVAGSALYRIETKRDPGGNLAPERRGPLRELLLDVGEGVFRVEVKDEADRAVAGARVTLEPADEADAFLRRYEEYAADSPRGKGGISLAEWDGRRAPPERRREGRTDDLGRARFAGRLPGMPLLLGVEAPGIPAHFETVAAERVASGRLAITVRRGGELVVHFPPWLATLVVERDDGWVLPLHARDPRMALEPGRYHVRVRGVGALAPPFEIAAGGRQEIDLGHLAPASRTDVRLAVPGVSDIAWRYLFAEPESARPMVDGRVRLESVWAGGESRLVFTWQQPASPLPIAHAHDVKVTSSVGTTRPSEVLHDLSYSPVRWTLRVRNAESLPQSLRLQGSKVGAPLATYHVMDVLIPARFDADVVFEGIPTGTYYATVGPPSFARCEPQTLVVRGDATDALEILDDHLEVVLRGSGDATASTGLRLPGYLGLIPDGADAPPQDLRTEIGRAAWFRSVRPGSYRVVLYEMVQTGPIHWGSGPPIPLPGVLRVEAGVHRIEIDGPAR